MPAPQGRAGEAPQHLAGRAYRGLEGHRRADIKDVFQPGTNTLSAIEEIPPETRIGLKTLRIDSSAEAGSASQSGMNYIAAHAAGRNYLGGYYRLPPPARKLLKTHLKHSGMWVAAGAVHRVCARCAGVRPKGP